MVGGGEVLVVIVEQEMDGGRRVVDIHTNGMLLLWFSQVQVLSAKGPDLSPLLQTPAR